MYPRFDGPKVRERRRAVNLTMAEFADAIERATGRRWHPGHLYNIEAPDGPQPGLKLSHAIADVLEVPWDQLWTEETAGAMPAPAGEGAR